MSTEQDAPNSNKDTGGLVAALSPRKLKTAPKKAAKSLKDSAKSVPPKVTGGVATASKRAASGAKTTLDKTTKAALDLVGVSEALLATDLASNLNSLMQDLVSGTATIYDKAMDASYILTHEGGVYHRLFDGGHTITGAIGAGRDASASDGVVQEALGTIQGLLRDGTTPMGLPFMTWDKATFDQVAGVVESHLHIPKDWFYDLNTYDATELLGSAVGVVGLALNWNRADAESFSKLVGSLGVSSAVGANPVLLIVTVAALAQAFHKARQSGEYGALVDGQFKGAIGAGSTLAAVSLVGVAGGPAGVALLAGLTTGILVNKATKGVSIIEISQVVAGRAKAAASEVTRAVSTRPTLASLQAGASEGEG